MNPGSQGLLQRGARASAMQPWLWRSVGWAGFLSSSCLPLRPAFSRPSQPSSTLQAQVFVLGGHDATEQSDVWVSSDAAASWELVLRAAPWVGRYWHSAAANAVRPPPATPRPRAGCALVLSVCCLPHRRECLLLADLTERALWATRGCLGTGEQLGPSSPGAHRGRHDTGIQL